MIDGKDRSFFLFFVSLKITVLIMLTADNSTTVQPVENTKMKPYQIIIPRQSNATALCCSDDRKCPTSCFGSFWLLRPSMGMNGDIASTRMWVVAGGIVPSTQRPYLSYSDGEILRVLPSQGRHVAPIEVKFSSVPLRAKFHPHRCRDWIRDLCENFSTILPNFEI